MKVRNLHAYDEDFAAWSAEQGRLIRARDFDAVDLDNVAEEIESLGRSDRHALKSRLTVLLAHLLKWQHQPDYRSTSWRQTIVEQRRRIRDLLVESPSLRAFVVKILPEIHADACEDAGMETGLPAGTFSEDCRFSLDQILGKDFYPGV
jgi:hypothetical protein